MKTIFYLFCSIFSIVNLNAQITKKDTVISTSMDANAKGNVRFKIGDKILIGNPCPKCPVLAIYNQKKYYAETVKSITDTLQKKYNYTLHFDRDTILRYTSERQIKNVLLIEKAE